MPAGDFDGLLALVGSEEALPAEAITLDTVRGLLADVVLTAPQCTAMAAAVKGRLVDPEGDETYLFGHEIYSRCCDPWTLMDMEGVPWHGTVGYYEVANPLGTPAYRRVPY